MELVDKKEQKKVKNHEYFRQYYHAHEEYRLNKNKKDNTRNKKRYREDPIYREKTIQRAHTRHIIKKLGLGSGNIMDFISAKEMK